MSSSRHQFFPTESPSRKKQIKQINEIIPDTSYEREQMRLQRKRDYEREIAETRFTLRYGTADAKQSI